jgi:glycosyltransferase involved in cell wall biosynthesis
MRIALVYDFLLWRGGAERCLEAFIELFPDAPIYTLFYQANRFPEIPRSKVIRTSFLDRLPLARSHHYLFLPLYPLAVESLRIEGFDIIVSNSWAWTKNIRIPQGTLHISYCYTPMRFAYHFFDEYTSHLGAPGRAVIAPLVACIKKWDRERSKDVDHFVAVSETVRQRIMKSYERESEVIYPPVNTAFFHGHDCPRENFYLLVSRLVPYKRVELAVRAFGKLKLPLKIVGSGGELQYLRKEATENVEFLGYVSDHELRTLYRKGKALIMPQIEDFGLVALEAQGCGMPVLAYAEGGSTETILEGLTGHLFAEQSSEALAAGLEEMNEMHFDPYLLRERALKFSKEHFISSFRRFMRKVGGALDDSL